MNILLTSIESIIPIIIIIVLGYVLQCRGWFEDSFGANLSRLIMNVALPASIFVSVMKYLTLDKSFRWFDIYIWSIHIRLYSSLYHRKGVQS